MEIIILVGFFLSLSYSFMFPLISAPQRASDFWDELTTYPLVFLFLFFFLGLHLGHMGLGGQIRAAAASLHNSHSSARSKPRLRPTPQFTAKQWELAFLFIRSLTLVPATSRFLLNK